eukprot:313568-Rhodomonas_salina.1
MAGVCRIEKILPLRAREATDDVAQASAARHVYALGRVAPEDETDATRHKRVASCSEMALDSVAV